VPWDAKTRQVLSPVGSFLRVILRVIVVIVAKKKYAILGNMRFWKYAKSESNKSGNDDTDAK